MKAHSQRPLDTILTTLPSQGLFLYFYFSTISRQMLGKKEYPPSFPVNLLGDFAGGGMLCALGICLALFERTKSGRGQVIDAAMIEGSAYLSTFIYSLDAVGMWKGRGENFLTGVAPFYDVYRTKDNEYMSVGAIEPQFYKELLKVFPLCHSQRSFNWIPTNSLTRTMKRSGRV